MQKHIQVFVYVSLQTHLSLAVMSNIKKNCKLAVYDPFYMTQIACILCDRPQQPTNSLAVFQNSLSRLHFIGCQERTLDVLREITVYSEQSLNIFSH